LGDALILWQSVPCWDMPSTSPFCIKVETWLRMANIAYEPKVISGPPKSPNKKVPYVQRPDGSIVADSGHIIATLTAERGVTLDDGLDARQRADALAITRLLEDHFYWAIAWDRWVPDAHWAQTKKAYFGYLSWPLPWLVPPLLRRSVIRSLHGQGFGRMSDDTIVARAQADLDALATVVGDAEHVLGRPSSLDATVYAFVEAATRPPWSGPLKAAAERHDNLMRFRDAIRQRWFS